MKVFATIIALASLASLGAANKCTAEYSEGMVSSYGILTDGQVPDIPGVCGGLWDNLKQFADCIGVGSAYCGDEEGRLGWSFTNGANCNAGMVEATWWDATKNKYGSIECSG